jgi:membrane peptidoglycan carboxypeptidase
VNTAYVDLTHSMTNGPQKVLDTAVKMGVPQDAPGLKAESGISLGSATINPIDMANSYGTIANGGQAQDWYTVSKVTSANGHTLYRDQHETRRALPNPIDRDVSYALQQVVKKGTGMNALALGRPAAGKTGTATNGAGDVDSSWFVGYTPQLSTAVMYVRGNGTEPLNGYMPSYFGADYPTQTWTSIMQKALAGAPVQSFPPPANVKARNTDHKPMPTFTPTPTPTPSPTPSPSNSPSPSPSMTPSPTPTPTPTPSPSPSGGGTFCPLGCPSNSPTGGGANDGGPGHGGGGGQGPPPHG